MLSKLVDLTFTGSLRVSDLPEFTGANTRCKAIALQALDTNTNPVYFGEPGSEAGFLKPDKSTLLPVSNTKNLALLGSIGEAVVIHVFE